ncbi:MAG: hypothetical protein IT245_08470 [Bacteroidia bacterium]|nr:hypothetical protein [Bacteroidia bacterium]
MKKCILYILLISFGFSFGANSIFKLLDYQNSNSMLDRDYDENETEDTEVKHEIVNSIDYLSISLLGLSAEKQIWRENQFLILSNTKSSPELPPPDCC